VVTQAQKVHLVTQAFKHSATTDILQPLLLTFRSAFLASGLTVPVAVSSCAASLRKVCEDLPNLSHESTNIAGLLRIGEVVVFLEPFPNVMQK